MADKEAIKAMLEKLGPDKLAQITVTENGKQVPITEYLNRPTSHSGNVSPTPSDTTISDTLFGKTDEANKSQKEAAATEVKTKPEAASDDDKYQQEKYTGTLMPFSFPVQKTDFPANAGMFFDESLTITKIQICPKNENVIVYGNGVTSIVTPQAARSLFQYGKSAPAMKITSMYNEGEMHARTFSDVLQDMDNEKFWKSCIQIDISGHWNNMALRRFTDSFTANISSLIMRKFTATTKNSGYRLDFAIARLSSLRYINADCRCLESGDITNAVNALSKATKGKTLKNVFLNVKGWYYDIHNFRMGFDKIKNMTEDDATITVLTERGLDKSIIDMLQECHFDYVGQGTSESMASENERSTYELFNCRKVPKFTYGFLQSKYTEVEVKEEWD